MQERKLNNYALVRGAITDLLALAEREFVLERDINRGFTTEVFGDDRRCGVLAFTLATICHRHPEAKRSLEQAINNKARAVALMQERSAKNAKSKHK